MRITDTLATNAIFRNNVNHLCLKIGDDYFTILSINNYNRDKLEHLEGHDMSFKVSLEDIHFNGAEFKCVIDFDTIETADDKFNCIVCTLDKRKSAWDCDEVRDYNVDLFSEVLKQDIRKLSLKYMGVHIVANWEDGSSDAVVLPLYTKEAFMREFPESNQKDVLSFYDGRDDGFECRKWKDDLGNIVTDTAYYAFDFRNECDNVQEYVLEDEKASLTVSLEIESFVKQYEKSKDQDK